MDYVMFNNAQEICEKGYGILAVDESVKTIGKRFAKIGVENTEENRRKYRKLLCTTEGLEKYIRGVILFEETLEQKDDNGKTLPEVLKEKGIFVGIKVDKGLVDLPNTNEETITKGLDDLPERLAKYKSLGATFAKWRNVYRISSSNGTPSNLAISSGVEVLARYAAICQSQDIVPILEPELLMEGDHSINSCAVFSDAIIRELYYRLSKHNVELDCTILKPNMIITGNKSDEEVTNGDIAGYTISVLRGCVPASVSGINFLSGGQSSIEATKNLQAINELADENLPWPLSFSFGRALQEDCLNIWQGKDENVEKAQQALLKRAELNSLASVGEYNNEMED